MGCLTEERGGLVPSTTVSQPMGTREGHTIDTTTHNDGFLYCIVNSSAISSEVNNKTLTSRTPERKTGATASASLYLGCADIQTAKATHLCCKGTFGMHRDCSGSGNAAEGGSALPRGCHCFLERLSFCLEPSYPHWLLFPRL